MVDLPLDQPKPSPKKKSSPKSKSKVKAPAECKPTKTLPNWRVGVAKQYDILRAYAASSNKGTKEVTLEDAAN